MLFIEDVLVGRNDTKGLFWLFLSEDGWQVEQVIKIVCNRGGDAAVRAVPKLVMNGTRNRVSGKILKCGSVRYG